MRLAVPAETAAFERRVALVPDIVGKLVKAGHEVVVQAGAGTAAGFPDAQYTAAGATLRNGAADTLRDAEVVLKVQRPSAEEVALLPSGAVLVAFLQPAQQPELLAQLAARRITAIAIELVPRITRAQSMDALSSQATVTGYKEIGRAHV